MPHRHVGVASLALLIGTSFASATTITFTESAIATGSLGSASFTNSLITLTATGDTSNVTQNPPGFFTLPGLGVFINIAGLGTANLAGGAVLSCKNNSCISTPPFPNAAAGFSDPAVGRDILDIIDGTFNTYDLTTSIGPITDSSLINASFPFQTDNGVFKIVSAGNATFRATIGTTATPEPATMALFGLGLAGCIASLKRRK